MWTSSQIAFVWRGFWPVAMTKIVGVGADGPHVEDDDVLRQLLLGEAGDAAGLFE